jgi:hypothetical protein
MRAARAVGAALALLLQLAGPAGAESGLLPAEGGAARTVRLFDLFCMTHVPDLDTIAHIASENFEELTGAVLQRYRPAEEPEVLRAWRFSEFGAEFVLVTARSAPGVGAGPDEPDFAAATSYDCTLVLPDDAPQGGIRDEMTALMNRPPDDFLSAGPVSAARWKGRTPDMLVNVLHYGPANGDPGGGLKSVAFILPPSPGKAAAATVLSSSSPRR